MENILGLMKKDSVPTFCPSSAKDWRRWLRENHKTIDSVWLVFYKKKTKTPSLTWSEAVDEALCFGWIDGKRLTVSDERYMQFFCKRRAKSTWSKINKQKVRRLIEQRKMTKAGYDVIALSKSNGSWKALDQVEKLVIPEDLESAFKSHVGLKRKFLSLSTSVKKLWLMELHRSKKTETRQVYISRIIERCGA